MIKNSYKLTFFSTMMIGTLMVISSNSWFSMWMGLEINLLSFIPLMIEKKNLFSSESTLKYFLVQAMASSTLLFSIILFMMFSKSLTSTSLILTSIMSTLLLKSGAAPFHFWLPNVMEGLSWKTNFIILTWQKIAPMLMLSYCLNYTLITFSIMTSVIFGAIGGLNQTSLRKIMAFSSINHLGWMMAAMIVSETLWEIYFFFYMFLNFSLVMIFNSKNFTNMNQPFNFSPIFLKICLFLNLLSMGGLPPFLGFFPKWMVIESMVNLKSFFVLNFILFFTLIAIYFYLRMAYCSLLFNNFNTNWSFKVNFSMDLSKLILICAFCNIFGLSFISLIFFYN